MPAIVNMPESISTVPSISNSSETIKQQEEEIHFTQPDNTPYLNHNEVFSNELKASSQQGKDTLPNLKGSPKKDPSKLPHQELMTPNALRPPSHALRSRRLSKVPNYEAVTAYASSNAAATERKVSLSFAPSATDKSSSDNVLNKRKGSFIHGNGFNTDFHHSAVSPRFMAFRKLSEVSDLPLHPALPMQSTNAYYQQQQSVTDERNISMLIEDMQQQLVQKIDNIIDTKLKYYLNQLQADLLKTRLETVQNLWEANQKELSDFAIKLKEDLIHLHEKRHEPLTAEKKEDVHMTVSTDSLPRLETVEQCSTVSSVESCSTSEEKDLLSRYYSEKPNTSWADMMQLEDDTRLSKDCLKQMPTVFKAKACSLESQQQSTMDEVKTVNSEASDQGYSEGMNWKLQLHTDGKSRRFRTRQSRLEKQSVVNGIKYNKSTVSNITGSTIRSDTSRKGYQPESLDQRKGSHCSGKDAILMNGKQSTAHSSSEVYSTKNGYLTFTTIINGQPSIYTVKIPNQNQHLSQPS